MTIFAWIVFYSPEMGGLFLEHPNFDPADPMKTPEHIQPVWYFTPFYSILRAIPSKLWGVVGMGSAIVVLFLLPWLDRCPVKSIRYRGPLFKIALWAFVLSFLGLGVLGTKPATEMYTMIARVLSVIYFSFFLFLPIFSSVEITKEVPLRVTESIVPLSQREGFQWRLIEEGIRALQHSPHLARIRNFLAGLRGKI